MRKDISTNTPSEQRVGYSRAVIINNRMYISGTTSVDYQGHVIGQDVETQADAIFQKIDTVLNDNGFTKADIVLVTAYLVAMGQVGQFDKSFSNYFEINHPACTLVGVSQLVDKKMLIEIAFMAEKAG